MQTNTRYLVASHPLAEVAARNCRHTSVIRVGKMACGRCWEKAIRDDERFAAECELPELDVDVDYIDEVAVQAAVSGACRGRLTEAERVEATWRMAAAGLSPYRIRTNLRPTSKPKQSDAKVIAFPVRRRPAVRALVAVAA